MPWLSDKLVERLRQVAEAPDLDGTRYRAIREIGRGGMGTVYLAEDAQLGRQVALKVLHPGDASPESAARMMREAHILAALEHPGIVPVHDAGTLSDGRVYYAMKFVQGLRLDGYRETAPAESELLRVFQKICEPAAFAHSHGVLHCDLKPENIMVGAFGEVLVMDWGVARLLGETEYGAVAGTPAYMAPEQARGDSAVDERADVYALGAILAFLLGGRPAPPRLQSICRKAMASEPERRYTGAEEFGADVARYLAGEPVLAHREGPLEALARLASRHRTAILLVLTYLVLRAVLFFIARR